MGKITKKELVELIKKRDIEIEELKRRKGEDARFIGQLKDERRKEQIAKEENHRAFMEERKKVIRLEQNIEDNRDWISGLDKTIATLRHEESERTMELHRLESRVDELLEDVSKMDAVQAKIDYMLSTDFLFLVKNTDTAAIGQLVELVRMATIKPEDVQ